ncbi:type IV pilin [Halobaculum magnesiiphilum]|uniref:Type IV pilin n=1 Tax=Halobaculum magnesiiphilum TaxID=1017351 RepID=A0A8T8WH09_9EURY|nr:type IV pilin [Halobaculum magnesiiphilum]
MLVLAAVALSATVGAATLSTAGVGEATTGDGSGDPAASEPRSAPVAAVIGVTVADGTITLTHRGGDTLDVRRLRVVIRVDGTRLRHQPPVPFFAARGFVSGPTGPFNLASDHAWSAGESTTVTPAGTNRPRIRPGTTVEVTLFVGSHRLAAPTAAAT